MKSETDIIQCDCGCTHFTVSRDGLIECAECGHPTDGLIAIEKDVHKELGKRGVKIIDKEAFAH